ncbi:unnamed protein product [Caenorhabditis bovis]|uniref:Peptidase C15, pyroglutamyl peptidase I-like protein n=1 Tax=Caenorhabditis bovis TaxID=2654633 RepID=A0A8S1FDD1_9PELO|nr:unnamed protein product [Caenorhabditis bovis]
MIGVGCPEANIPDMLTMCTPVSEPVCLPVHYTPTVVITGFGPFRDFANNPSSLVVDELEKEGIPGVDLKLHKLSVAYDECTKTIPELWESHNPDLVIHIGAQDIDSNIRLEQQAFSNGYYHCDVNGCTPESNTTGCCRAENVLKTGIDCVELAEKLKAEFGIDGTKYDGLDVVCSDDPGRYLCGFSYFISLDKNSQKALFIHVPAITENRTEVDFAQIIRHVVKTILNL